MVLDPDESVNLCSLTKTSSWSNHMHQLPTASFSIQRLCYGPSCLLKSDNRSLILLRLVSVRQRLDGAPFTITNSVVLKSPPVRAGCSCGPRLHYVPDCEWNTLMTWTHALSSPMKTSAVIHMSTQTKESCMMKESRIVMAALHIIIILHSFIF